MYLVVLITCPDKKTSEKLSEILLENRLAACVNTIPDLISRYWWNGKKYKSEEVLMIVKTKESLLKELTRTVKKNHPYENPEVIALPITGGSKKYTQWIEQETKTG